MVSPRRRRLLAKIVSRGFLGFGVIGWTLFGLAGRVDWPAAWGFLSMLGVYLLLGGFWFFLRDPDLLEERMTAAPNVPRWDRLVVRSYWLLLAALFVTAALDAGRFRWSEMPAAMQWLGGAALVASFAGIWWCTSANHFLSSHARLQIDRGQRVVQHGPYRFVRHPMYASLIVLTVGVALLLGSWLAVLPGGLIGVLLAIRTSLEDRMLSSELDGYREYANQVPERLIPGLW